MSGSLGSSPAALPLLLPFNVLPGRQQVMLQMVESLPLITNSTSSSACPTPGVVSIEDTNQQISCLGERVPFTTLTLSQTHTNGFFNYFFKKSHSFLVYAFIGPWKFSM